MRVGLNGFHLFLVALFVSFAPSPTRALTFDTPLPPGMDVAKQHFTAIAEGNGVGMVDELYDFGAMARRAAPAAYSASTPAQRRYAADLLSVFFKSNLRVPGMAKLTAAMHLGGLQTEVLPDGHHLLRYTMTGTGPYAGLVPPETGALLVADPDGQPRIVDTMKYDQWMSRFLADAFTEEQKKKGTGLTLVDFLEEMITTHQENLSAIAAGLAQLHARAADQPVAPTATVPTPSVPKPPAPPLTPSQPVHGPKPDGEANPSPSGEGVPEERERGG